MADVAYIPGERGRVRRPAVGYAMIISAALLFALNGTVSKVVLQSGLSPLELTQVRATGAFLGFALILLFTRRRSLRLSRRELPYLIAFGIAGVALVQWLYFVSIGRLAGTLRQVEGIEAANANLMGQVMLSWDDELTTRDVIVETLSRGGFPELQQH